MNATIYVNRGETAILACKTFRSAAADRDRGLKRVWRKAGAQDPLGFTDRIWSLQDELRVRNVVVQDSGNYTCTVANMRAQDSVSYELVVQDVPGMPRLEVKSANADSLDVKLEARSAGPSLPVVSCSFFYKQMYGVLNEVLLPGNHEGDFRVRELECGRTYQVYARCANRLGTGAISRQFSQRTLGEKPEIPPESAFVHPSNDSVRLDLFAWNAETCPVTYFVVDYRKRRVRKRKPKRANFSVYRLCRTSIGRWCPTIWNCGRAASLYGTSAQRRTTSCACGQTTPPAPPNASSPSRRRRGAGRVRGWARPGRPWTRGERTAEVAAPAAAARSSW